MLNWFYEGPPVYSQVSRALVRLRETYPALKVFPAGKSALGRQIYTLCVGSPCGAPLLAGGLGGSEYLSCTLLLRFCERLLHAHKSGRRIAGIDARRILARRSFAVIPCLNPDGVEIALRGFDAAGDKAEALRALAPGESGDAKALPLRWQANANGVDLRRNFDADWVLARANDRAAGIAGPGPAGYGGEHPHSEAETMAVSAFCTAFRPRCLYTVHTGGDSGKINWRGGEHTPVRSRTMAQILASSGGCVPAANEDSRAGLKDWFIEKLRRPAFTIHPAAPGPAALANLAEIYAGMEEMLILALML